MALLQVSLFLVSMIVSINCHSMYNASLMSHDCLKNRAIAADYTPQGRIINIGNLPVYEYQAEDNVNTKRMLVGVYDIYGLAYPNLKQVADQLAVQNGGFRVILPDFYREDSWNPDGQLNMTIWIDSVGNWENIVKPDLINVANYYRNEGVEEFAIYGMCWGGKVATLAAIQLSDIFKASGLVHPSSVTNEEANEVLIPMYLMPASNDPDMSLFYEVLQQNFSDNTGHRRFEDMTHGFAGARGNFSDPVVVERVNEVITTLGAFFDRNLYETKQNNSPIARPAGYVLMVALVLCIFTIRRS